MMSSFMNQNQKVEKRKRKSKTNLLKKLNVRASARTMMTTHKNLQEHGDIQELGKLQSNIVSVSILLTE